MNHTAPVQVQEHAPRQGPAELVTKAPYRPVTLEQVQRLRQCYETGQYGPLTQELLYFLRQLDDTRTAPVNAQEQPLLALALRLITLFMQDPAYRIELTDLFHLVPYAALLGNAFRLAGLGTTDETVQALDAQPAKWGEQLLLSSLHNETLPDLSRAARASPSLLSLWWDKLFKCHYPTLDKAMHRRALALLQHPVLREHYLYMQEGSVLASSSTFFCCSYYDYRADSRVKPFMNRGVVKCLKQHLLYWPDLAAQTQPRDFGTIVVISRVYFKAHAVYRSLAPLIQSWKGRWRLVLIGLIDPQQEDCSKFNTEDFEEHYWFASIEKALKTIVEEIRPGVVYFTDIGMSNDSIVVSNLRLAPIQVTGYGHPLSTFSPQIDYFIGSAEAELPEKARDYYSEKPVLIPGLAAAPVMPAYRPEGGVPDEREGIFISLAWGRHKLNRDFLLRLKPVLDRCNKKARFCLSGIIPGGLAFPLLQRQLDALLGAGRYLMFPTLDQQFYYPLIEGCHFGIDSHPFGSYNRLIDSLLCARPILVREGDHFINRAGACMLRQLGLEELVARDDSELLDKAVRLVDDTAYRCELSERIGAIDLEAALHEHNPPHAYRAAMAAILADYHAGKTQDKTPIVMTREAL